jgi:hypothetical protein
MEAFMEGDEDEEEEEEEVRLVLPHLTFLIVSRFVF